MKVFPEIKKIAIDIDAIRRNIEKLEDVLAVDGLEYREPCCIGDNDKESDWDDLIVFSGFADWNMPKPINAVSVIRETVGQYTGMNDKNGKKIFEGDIVTDGKENYTVCYGLAGFYLRYAPPEEHGFSYTLLPLSNYQHAHSSIIEVIGNVHETK